jgi:hypothetical protein
VYESTCRELRHGKIERIFFLVGRRASTVAAYHAPEAAAGPSALQKFRDVRRALSRGVPGGKVLVTTAA